MGTWNFIPFCVGLEKGPSRCQDTDRLSSAFRWGLLVHPRQMMKMFQARIPFFRRYIRARLRENADQMLVRPTEHLSLSLYMNIAEEEREGVLLRPSKGIRFPHVATTYYFTSSLTVPPVHSLPYTYPARSTRGKCKKREWKGKCERSPHCACAPNFPPHFRALPMPLRYTTGNGPIMGVNWCKH